MVQHQRKGQSEEKLNGQCDRGVHESVAESGEKKPISEQSGKISERGVPRVALKTDFDRIDQRID